VQQGEVFLEAHFMGLHVLRIFVDFLEKFLHLRLSLFLSQSGLILLVFGCFINEIEHSKPIIFGVTCNELSFGGLK
jgi:hypothetical protein